MLVLIRGAGDIATGIALRLWRSHIQVIMTDLARPTAIRRTVAFSQAILAGAEIEVEGVAGAPALYPIQVFRDWWAVLLERGSSALRRRDISIPCWKSAHKSGRETRLLQWRECPCSAPWTVF